MSFLRSKAYGSTFVLAAKPFTLKAVNSKPRGSLRRSQIFFPREEIKWQFGGKKSLACELGVLPVFFCFRGGDRTHFLPTHFLPRGLSVIPQVHSNSKVQIFLKY